MSTLKDRRSNRRNPIERVRIEVACNDGDNGIFAGRAEGLAFVAAGERIGLDLQCWPAPKFTETDKGIRFFRRNCEVFESKEYYGNWCWNAYLIGLSDAAFLLYKAVRTEKFGFDMAEGDNACRLTDAFDEDADLGEVTLYLSLFGS